MEGIIVQLSEKLGMSAEVFIESYPALKQQYIVYESLMGVYCSIVIISLITPLVLLVASLFVTGTDVEKSISNWIYKNKNILIISITLLYVILIALSVLAPILASEYLILEKLL